MKLKIFKIKNILHFHKLWDVFHHEALTINKIKIGCINDERELFVYYEEKVPDVLQKLIIFKESRNVTTNKTNHLFDTKTVLYVDTKICDINTFITVAIVTDK